MTAFVWILFVSQFYEQQSKHKICKHSTDLVSKVRFTHTNKHYALETMNAGREELDMSHVPVIQATRAHDKATKMHLHMHTLQILA